MVSSHILPELADICNKVGIIEQGVLLECTDVADLMGRCGSGRSGNRRERRPDSRRPVVGEQARWRRSRAATAACGHVGQGTTDYSDLPTLLVASGYKLTLFKEDELNLETAFMALTKGITA